MGQPGRGEERQGVRGVRGSPVKGVREGDGVRGGGHTDQPTDKTKAETKLRRQTCKCFGSSEVL